MPKLPIDTLAIIVYLVSMTYEITYKHNGFYFFVEVTGLSAAKAYAAKLANSPLVNTEVVIKAL